MQGDFSRQTFDPLRRFCRVLMQQGRVQLDADWNEQVAILLHYVQTLAKDIIGSHGGTKGSFEIQNLVFSNEGNDFAISAGHYYVDGILCELEGTPIPIIGPIVFQANGSILVQVATWVVDHREFKESQYVEILDAASQPLTRCKIGHVEAKNMQLTLQPEAAGTVSPNAENLQLRRITTYLTQPDYHPDPKDFTSSLEPTPYLVYLDVWERHLSYLEDEGDLNIREVALGGPDTATRTKVVWQVRVIPTTAPPPSKLSEVMSLLRPQGHVPLSQVYLRARAHQEQSQPDPCLIQPDARYRGAENQLYRVEIHTGGTVGKATFKWSRENASVTYPVISLQGTTATLANLGRDKHLSLKVGDWVEVVDDETTLRGEPGQLVQVDVIEPTDMIVTFKEASRKSYSSDSDMHPLLRRWDYQGRDNAALSTDDHAITIIESNDEDTAHWFVLEDGVQIQFPQPPKDAQYRTGDYWLIPARTATGDVEWPREGGTDQTNSQRRQAILPHGVEHHYAPLAIVSRDTQGKVTLVGDLTANLRKEIIPLLES